MKYLLFSFMLLATCNDKTIPPASMMDTTFISQCWKVSYEDKMDDVEVFRTCKYDFPPSRGREGVTFEADGSFIYSKIAPTDGFNELSGKWSVKAKKLTMTYTKPVSKVEVYDIVELKSQMMKLKKIDK